MGTKPVGSSAGQLSRREREIAALVAEGLTNREIAARLFISERTVDGHLEHVREKLGVNTRAQVAAWVARQSDAAAGRQPTFVSRPVTRFRIVAHPRLWLAACLVLALLAAGVGVVRLLTPPPTIETIAGVPCPFTFPGGCYSGDGNLAITAGLARPNDIVATGDGSIYIAESSRNARVRRIGTNGIISTIAGGGNQPLTEGAAADAVMLGYPNSITVDAKGNLYILTSHEGFLEVWLVRTDRTIRFFTRIGPSSNSTDPNFWIVPAGGLAVAQDGTLFVADRAGNRVWAVANGDKPVVFAGTGEAGYSGDRGAAKAAKLYWPTGLAIGKHGEVYIADTENNRIRYVNALGIIDTVVGNGRFFSGSSLDTGPPRQVRLKIPIGVAVRSDGTLFIADTGDNRVVELPASGQVVNAAGTGQSGFLGDGGRAIDAALSGPEAVAIAPNNALLVADTENERVRQVRPSP